MTTIRDDVRRGARSITLLLLQFRTSDDIRRTPLTPFVRFFTVLEARMNDSGTLPGRVAVARLVLHVSAVREGGNNDRVRIEQPYLFLGDTSF